jgi:hypothetical protein
MCEYDYHAEVISERYVTTRKAHCCGTCENGWPKGTHMYVQVGKCEGDFYSVHVCPVCDFATGLSDHSPLHLCSDWRQNANEDDEWKWDYLKWCHDNGETPTETQWLVVCNERQKAEDAA